MKIRFTAPRPLLAMAVLFAFSACLFGQRTDSIIVGTVTDATGAAVPNAKVTATNKDTNVKYDTVSNSAGEYRINNVPAGTYEVSAAASGFNLATVAGVDAELNHTATVNINMTVGNVTTAVEVQEAAAIIDTATAQLQTNFDSRTAIDVPSAGFSRVINGAGIYNLSLVGAGVASSGGVGQGTGPSIAGQRPENNSFNIDGVPNNDAFSTGPQIYVSNEAVAQLNVVQNQFSAEYGGASGGVFNVIVKTGTNHVHGSIFEYNQNRDLNALDYSYVVAGLKSYPRFDQNRIGATVGGPIIKDKLFYFGSYEYNPLGQASNPGQPITVPTAAGIAALNGLSGISKTNLGVFTKYVPVASTATGSVTVNGTSISTGPLVSASANFNNAYHAIIAIDYNLSSKDQIRGRWIYDKSAGLDNNAALPVFYEPNPDTNKMASVSEFHNFSATMENELRVAYRRNNAVTSAGNFQFPGLDVFPNISFDDLSLQMGPDPNTPSGAISDTASLQENVTKTWGQHTFKAGYEATDVILANTFIQRARGDYDYLSLQQFLLDQKPTGTAFGTPQSAERSFGSPSGVPLGFLQQAAYFNDDWRVRRNLTLNIGLRYEYVTVPVGSRYQSVDAIASVPGVISFAAPKSSKDDFAPRLGFAYSPGKEGKWSIRGGVARSFDNTYDNLNGNAAPPAFQTTVDESPATPPSNFLANGGLHSAVVAQPTVAQLRASVASYTFDQTRPYALTGTIGVQRLLKNDYVFEARYVYTKGVHLWNQTHLNQSTPVTPTNSLPTYFSTPSAAQLAGDKVTLGQIQNTIVPGGTAQYPYDNLAIYGFTSAITGYHPWGNSRYNGLALQMTKRYSRNFSVIAAYTWSHNFDDSTATNFSTILSPRRAEDFQNMRLEWASSALDRRHRLTLTPVYDFKPFQNGNWLMKNVVGNWNISGTYTFQSPEFATVQDGIDANMNGGDAAGDRPVVNPAGAANIGSAVTGLNAAGQAVAAGSAGIVAYVANNPNARYVVAGLGALENAGRNTYPLGRINNFDVALMKKFSITERTRVEFGAQFFNLLNHSQFVGGYISDVSPKQTNAISNTFLVPSSAHFGAYQQYFPSNSRQLQLVARIVF